MTFDQRSEKENQRKYIQHYYKQEYYHSFMIINKNTRALAESSSSVLHSAQERAWYLVVMWDMFGN